MQIDLIPELSLTSAHEAEIAALLARCFDTDFGGRSFYQQRHHLRILARDTDLIGHIALMLRAVRIGDELTDIAGLAEVATDPAHRGQGIAATLLQAAIAQAMASPAQFLLLFGTAQLYASAGFVAVRNPMRWIDLSGARMGLVQQQAAQALMVLPLRGQTWDAAAPIDMLGNLF
jgi:predicted N-acetyltransferase YhbS